MTKKEFGGYLPLEIPKYNNEYYQSDEYFNVISLNSGRSSFYFAAKTTKMRKIYLPIFNCAETKIPFKKLNIEIEYYKLDDQLLPKDIYPKKNEFILWTNYYGNASEKEKQIIQKRYPNLIIDNCHAFFSKPIKGAYNCYSPRKFFGVCDGAYLIKDNYKLSEKIEVDTSYQSFSHLIKQIDLGINSGYLDSLENEKRLNEKYLRMSKLTKKILKSIDYEKVFNIRRRNFIELHKLLGEINEFPININSKTHMNYPFLIKDRDLRYKLIEQKLFNPFLWKHVLDLTQDFEIENKLSKYTVMLPIDQRYELKDILNIAKLVKNSIT